MPLVRISLCSGKSPSYRRALADEVHAALVETISIPKDDRFQLIEQLAADDFIYDPAYLGISRTKDLVMVQITLNAGRSVELKKKLYARVVERLHVNPGVKPGDVLISLIEVGRENWSFGNGIAQYAPTT